MQDWLSLLVWSLMKFPQLCHQMKDTIMVGQHMTGSDHMKMQETDLDVILTLLQQPIPQKTIGSQEHPSVKQL